MKNVLAFDLGASSGRAILASLENGKITLNEVHRFENNGVQVRGTLYWDILYLFDQIKRGITAAKLAGGFDSIGIDTWGVDFGLLGKDGQLLENPVHYRDSRTDNIMDQAFAVVPAEDMYARTGIQFMPFNTIFQLYYLQKNKPALLQQADKLLFIPDLLGYFLTGKKKSEYTIASTSQMLNPKTRDWDRELLSKLDIPTHLLCDIIQPGTQYGMLSDDICAELGVPSVPVIAVGAHDTASAVASVPTQEDDFVYISCGTWSLFGTELQEVNLSPEGAKLQYTNEGGVGGTIRYLSNIMGLWLIQESRRTWIKQGQDVSYNDLEHAALAAKPFESYIDPDNAAFAPPGDMPKRVQEFCARTGQTVPQTQGDVMRCIYQSLALKYRHAFENLKTLTGKTFSRIHIVGGGTKDPLLCQMTADACGVPVLAGPIEATALGNVAVQFMAAGTLSGVKPARQAIFDSFDLKEYQPQEHALWDEKYNEYKKTALI